MGLKHETEALNSHFVKSDFEIKFGGIREIDEFSSADFAFRQIVFLVNF